MLPHSADAASAGKKCSKRGVERVVGNTTLVCSGKNKLTWKRKSGKASSSSASRPTTPPAPSPVVTPPATTPATGPGGLSEPKEIGFELLSPAEMCKTKLPKEPGWEYENFGFPRSADLLPSTGELSLLIINVDFADQRSSSTPTENAQPYSELFEKYWLQVSRGKLKVKVETFDQWISLPKRAFEYAGRPPHRDIDKYAQEALNVADPFIDFSKHQIVAIIPPADIRNFLTNGPVLASGKFDKYKTNEGPVYNLTVGPEPRYPMGGVKWLWLAHEFGHMIGLSHPHNYVGNDVTKMSIFSLMDAGFVAPGLYGWERWRMNWINQEEIRCIADANSNLKSIYKLLPLGSPAGTQLIVLKLNEYEALVIENRRKNEFDNLPRNYEGVLVYHVNSSVYDGGITPVLAENYVIDMSKPDYNGSRVVGTIKVGQKVIFGNHVIEVLYESGQDFYVGISKKS